MTYGTKPLAARKPGSFKAFCKISTWVPWDPEAHGVTVRTRWDRKLNSNVTPVQCDATFTDAAAFEAHMADVHGRKLGQLQNADGDWKAHRLPMSRNRWRPTPALKPDGQQLVDRDKRTRACPHCDLVGEIRDAAAELWWDEHLRGCELAMAGAAS